MGQGISKQSQCDGNFETGGYGKSQECKLIAVEKVFSHHVQE